MLLTRARVTQFQRFELGGNQASYCYACEPFVVGGNNLPGCPFRARVIKDVFISADIVVPELALFHVSQRKLLTRPYDKVVMFHKLFPLAIAVNWSLRNRIGD